MSWIITGSEKTPLDQDYRNVSLLLHGDGANGSITIMDSSPSPKTITVVGDSQISTAIADPFGRTTAGVLAFDGNGDYLTTTIAGGIGSGDFTLEFWYYKTVDSGMLFNSRTSGTGSDGFDIESDFGVTSSGDRILQGLSIAVNQWHHLALVRNAGAITRYLNGISNGSVARQNNYTGSAWTIGGSPYGNIGYITGYIDDFRFTRTVRYTGNFTPPTAPFPDAGPAQ